METTLSRRDRERLLRRQAMLSAAQAVFAEKGYANATLEEIAHRAEFGKGTLYNYFEGGKEDILFAIFDEIYDDLCNLIDETFVAEAERGRPLAEAFELYVEACITFFLARQDLFMILTKEAHRMIFSADDVRAAYFKRQMDRMVQALVPTLQAAMDAGELKPLPATAVAHMFLGNINGFQMHLCMCMQDEAERHAQEEPLAGDARPQRLQHPGEAARFLTTMLFDGLLANPKAASAAP